MVSFSRDYFWRPPSAPFQIKILIFLNCQMTMTTDCVEEFLFEELFNKFFFFLYKIMLSTFIAYWKKSTSSRVKHQKVLNMNEQSPHTHIISVHNGAATANIKKAKFMLTVIVYKRMKRQRTKKIKSNGKF